MRDDLLETAPAKATVSSSHFAGAGANVIAERLLQNNAVSGIETTTSTTYTGTLSGGAGTAGPSVSAATGTKALVSFSCRQSTSAGGVNVWTSIAWSGASPIAASDQWATSYDQTGQLFHGLTYIESGLTPGTNTAQMQYRISSAGTATFAARRVNMVPF